MKNIFLLICLVCSFHVFSQNVSVLSDVDKMPIGTKITILKDILIERETEFKKIAKINKSSYINLFVKKKAEVPRRVKAGTVLTVTSVNKNDWGTNLYLDHDQLDRIQIGSSIAIKKFIKLTKSKFSVNSAQIKDKRFIEDIN